jgi:hypothetical protein
MSKSKRHSMFLLTASLAAVLTSGAALRANSVGLPPSNTLLVVVGGSVYPTSPATKGGLSVAAPDGALWLPFHDLAGPTGYQTPFIGGPTARSAWSVVIASISSPWAAAAALAVPSDATSNIKISLASIESLGVVNSLSPHWVENIVPVPDNKIISVASAPAITIAQGVPLPSAVWTGLSALFGLGLLAFVRRTTRQWAI